MRESLELLMRTAGCQPESLRLRRNPLDNWDAAVTDPLASEREVILFDSAGVGRSTGTLPNTIGGMAAHALFSLSAEWSRSRWSENAPRLSAA